MIGQALLWGGIALAASPVVAWLFLVWWRHPAVAYAFGIGISVFSLTHFGAPALRFAIVLPLVPHIAFAILQRQPSNRGQLPSPVAPIIYVAMCALSLLWSQAPSETLSGVAAWAVVLTFILTFRQLLTPETIKNTTFIVLLVYIIASVPFFALSIGWWNGRARGIFENANSLGIICLLTLGLAMWQSKRVWIPLLIPLLGIIVITASRASLLAAATLILIAVFPRLRAAYKWLVVLVATIAVYPTLVWVLGQELEIETTETSVLRTNNSREEAWGRIFDIIERNPLLGVGYDAGPAVIANSYLKMLAEFGIIASIAGMALIVTYLAWARRDITLFAFTVAACIDTVFEDWLITAGAPYLLIFLMVLMSTPKSNPLTSTCPSSILDEPATNVTAKVVSPRLLTSK